MAIQAHRIATTIRPTLPQGVIYIPVVHSDLDDRTYFPELRTGDTTRATLVADICSAQHEDITAIIAVDLAAGQSWDASAEIAQLVLEHHVREDGGVPRWGRDFLEKHLGIRHVIAAETWAEVA